jgi:hypothetical protein
MTARGLFMKESRRLRAARVAVEKENRRRLEPGGGGCETP